MRWYDSPDCSSSSSSVARRNSRSGAPSKLEPTSFRSRLRFLSENGKAATLSRAVQMPREPSGGVPESLRGDFGREAAVGADHDLAFAVLAGEGKRGVSD